MDTCSYFIQNKALFGSLPNDQTVSELEKIGVKYFVDLTSDREKVKPYSTNFKVLQYPIPDRKIPKNAITFCEFAYKIFHLIKHLKDNEKVYVHCKGGHGRSGIIVASILCLFYKIPPEVALDLTRFYHRQRKTMRDKWRRIGSPQTYSQKAFVIKLFEPFYFNTQVNGYLSNAFLCIIEDNKLGKFQCVESAYQAHKNPNDKKYVAQLQNCTSIKEIKNLGKTTILRPDWENVKDGIMYSLVKLKFDSRSDLKLALVETLMKPIVYKSNDTSYWTDKAHNRLGKMLQKIRNEYYLQGF